MKGVRRTDGLGLVHAYSHKERDKEDRRRKFFVTVCGMRASVGEYECKSQRKIGLVTCSNCKR